jgi:hypothetical protein
MTNKYKGEFMRYLPLLNKVYYPGSGGDLETLSFILSELKFVEDIIYCDYIEHLQLKVLSSIRMGGFEFKNIYPYITFIKIFGLIFGSITKMIDILLSRNIRNQSLYIV